MVLACYEVNDWHDYHFTYINTDGCCNRFEFYPDNNEFQNILKDIYAPIMYTSGPAMKQTREGVLSKRYEILPSPVWGADREAKQWRDSIMESLTIKLKRELFERMS